MEAELQEIYDFIAQYPPFDQLPEEALTKASQAVEIRYIRADNMIFQHGSEIYHLYMLRSGAVEVYRRKGELYNRLDQGSIFGQMGLLMKNKIRFPAKAIEDTLVYMFPEEIFSEFCDKYEYFSDFVEVEDVSRLRQVVSNANNANDLTTSKVKSLLTQDAILLEHSASIQQAAQVMAEENISAVLIRDPDYREDVEEDGLPFSGILTDRDLCSRVLAKALPSTTPVWDIMSRDIIVLDSNAYIFEAMLTMLRNNVKHLPVMKNKQAIGIAEISDIVRYESQNSLLLVQSIFSQSSREELITLSSQVQDCFVRMVNEDANSHMIGSAMSVIGRSFIQRLCELAEEELGNPPIPYCFLTLGSMARDEQLIVTDQDNAIIFDNSYSEKKHGEYFEKLAQFVCDALEKCGYDHCSGEIMASNPEWRKTRSQWEEHFGDWIENPKPLALLNSCIFFDLDGVWGCTSWAKQLNLFISRKARYNKRFLSCMAHNALGRTPPLGFFKNFVMEKDGQQKNSINLKRRGTAPLADLVRVHALAIGSRSQNSLERIDDIIEANILPEGRAADLRDAMEYISMVRLRHQAIDIEQNNTPDNNIEPENMSDFERRNLKDAFQILSNAQNYLKFHYKPNSFK